MDMIDTEYFKDILETRLKVLKGFDDKGSLINCIKEEGLSDPGDKGLNETRQQFLVRMKSREIKLIEKIEAALERIDEGHFGICIRCGQEIPLSRLMARPIALRCIACKEKEEQLKKYY